MVHLQQTSSEKNVCRVFHIGYSYTAPFLTAASQGEQGVEGNYIEPPQNAKSREREVCRGVSHGFGFGVVPL